MNLRNLNNSDQKAMRNKEGTSFCGRVVVGMEVMMRKVTDRSL